MATPPESSWHGPLTRLARLAHDEPEAETWITELLESNMPEIVPDAVAVALETGEPLPRLLAEAIARHPSVAAAEALARKVPIHTPALQDAAIAALETLLADPGWPADEDASAAPVRRHALRVALAARLVAQARFAEARDLALAAIAEAGDLPDEESVRARLIDANDALGEAQSALGEPAAAAESAARSLELRLAGDDPQRSRAEGRLRLAASLMAIGSNQAAVEHLVLATEETDEALSGHRDPTIELEEAVEAAGEGEHVRIPVRIGWLPSGFDDVVIDAGMPAEVLSRMLAVCAAELVRAVAASPDLPRPLLIQALDRLEASRPRLLQGEPLPLLEVEVLELLGAHPEYTGNLDSAARAEALEQAAVRAGELGEVELAIRARTAQAQALRSGDGERQDLVNSLQARGQLLESMGRPEEAVAVTREAAALAEGEEEPFVLHNLARRLAAAGQAREAFETSSRAIALLGERFLAEEDGQLTPGMMASMMVSLSKRAEECEGAEIEVTPLLADTTVALLDRVGLRPDTELEAPVRAAYAVAFAAEGQGDLELAERVYEAVVRLASRRPDDPLPQYARSLLGSNLCWKEIERGDLAAARRFQAEVAGAAEALPDERLIAEHGKASVDLISAYQQAGDIEAARELARSSLGAMLSPPYLEMRRQELGADQDEFVAAIEALAGSGGEV